MFILLFLLNSLAWSEPGIILNKNSRPVGEKEMLFGNTGIGGVNSAGAVFFNPGALTQIKEEKLSISGSTYLYYSGSFDPLVQFDNSSVEYQASGFNTLPSSLISVKNWNDYKFAFSILTPYSLQLENKVTTTTNNYEINILQNLSVDDLWMGISLAQVFESPLNKANKSSWGVSLYAVKHSETSTTNINFDRKTAPSAGQPDLLMATQRETLDSYGLLAVFGILQEFDTFRWGVRLQLPYLQVYNRASYLKDEYFTILPTITRSLQDEQSFRGDFRMPTDLSSGVVFHLGDGYELAWDVGVQFAEQYHPYKEVTNDQEVITDTTMRTSVGLRYIKNSKKNYFLGLSYSPTTKDKAADGVRANEYGISGGAHFIYDHFYTGIGTFFTLAKGTQPYDIGGGQKRDGKVNVITGGLVFTSGYNF